MFSVIAWQLAARLEQKVVEARFEVDAAERALLIRRQFDAATSALEDLASLYAVNDVVTGEQFSRFVSPILARQRSIYALSWNPVVRLADRQAHEAELREKGIAGYRITQRSAQNDIVTAPAREQYVVVAAIEPFAENQSAVGFDVSSEDSRRRALERARDSGTSATAAPISLIQGKTESRGALVFLPKYARTKSVITLEDRRANVEGYFVAVIDVATTIAAAWSNLDTAGIELRVLTTAPGAAEAELYASSQWAGSDARGPLPDFSATFLWGGHQIEMQFVASNAYAQDVQAWVSVGALLAGLVLTIMTTAMVYLLWGRTIRVEREVADRTRDIEEANLVLESEVARRTAVEERLEGHQNELEGRVAERTAELKTATDKLRTILDSEPECVKIISSDGELEDMNPAGLAMIEAESIEQVRGCDVYSLIAEEDRASFIDLNQRVARGESGTLVFRLNGLRGGKRWVETHAVPFIETPGGPVHHLAITRDITTKRKAEKDQARLEGQLRQAQKLEGIGVLAGGIAHDFNNLLQVIIGNSELVLADNSVNDTVRNALKASYAAALDGAKLCDQMLTYAGKSRPKLQSIHIPLLVESMIDLLRVSVSKNVEFEVNYEGEPDMVEGNDAQLSQIVMNLLTNASDAVGPGPGRIVVNIRTAYAPTNIADGDWIGSVPPAGRYVCLEVSDTGCGMKRKTKERMFDPFFTTKFTGRGLGLSSTLGIVRGHRGYLSVTSEIAVGTCFTVLFPASAATDTIAPRLPSVPGSFDQTILLVDDDEPVRRVGRMMLEKLGFQVVQATNGEEAVACFSERSDAIDAVLLDVTMPKMNGNEACAEMRRIRPDIAVIFCSGFANDVVDEDIAGVGFTGFLHKPYVMDDLARVLLEALGGKRQTKTKT